MADPESHVKTLNLIALETGSELAVASAGVAYSKSFFTPNFDSAAIEFQFDSAGSVDVKVEVESGGVAPTTEGSADTTNYAVGNTISSGITDENVHFNAPAPTVSKYLRFKFTGQGANAASTKLTKLKFHYIAKE